jgi:hypothetical protein
LSTAAIRPAKTTHSAKEPKEKVKSDKDDGDKLGEYDEIIIKKKGDKGGKVTVEIKGDDVIVNGSLCLIMMTTISLFAQNNVTVWNGNARAFNVTGSPFRYRSGDFYTISDRAFLEYQLKKMIRGHGLPMLLITVLQKKLD